MHPVLAGAAVVYFDAVGTLIHPNPPVADAYRAAGLRYGFTLERAEVQRRFRQAFATSERDPNGRTDERHEAERWRGIVDAVFPGAPTTLYAELHAHFARPDAWVVKPADVVTLRRLADAGLRLGVASNFDRRLHAVLDGLELGALLPSRAVSSEVGWRKPAAGFFDAACRLADVEPAAVVLVGDDYGNDYEGATAAGWRAVLLGDDARATVRIVRLEELYS